MYQVKKIDGVYSCPEIKISIEDWLSLLDNKEIFTEESLTALMLLYSQPQHKGICSEIASNNGIKTQKYSALIRCLGERICKQRGLTVLATNGSNTYWIVLMESGKYIGDLFEWQMRPELVAALQQYEDEYCDGLTTEIIISGEEGKKTQYFTTRYERKIANREAAIRCHGLKCMACEFDYGKTYGELGQGFIEVHHVVPLSDLNQEVKINPKTDLVCLCSNCHKMIHRKRNTILSVDDIMKIIHENDNLSH